MSEAKFPTEWLGHKLRVTARLGATPATSWVLKNERRAADDRLSVSWMYYAEGWQPWLAQASVKDGWGSMASYLGRGSTPEEAMAKCESLLVRCRGHAALTELRCKWAFRE